MRNIITLSGKTYLYVLSIKEVRRNTEYATG